MNVKENYIDNDPELVNRVLKYREGKGQIGMTLIDVDGKSKFFKFRYAKRK